MSRRMPTRRLSRRRALWAAVLVWGAAILWGSPARADDDAWAELKDALFGDREILDGADWLTLEAPYRAEDAAIVPIEVRALRPQDDASYIETITLVIDQNPAPVAAVIHLGPRSGLASFATRVRVNAYSTVRAIAETNEGGLYMAAKFVKASGGCSAPAAKDHDQALANLGQMRWRPFGTAPAAPGLQEGQLMIRHPNYSGLQMDQITRTYTPAHFVQDIEVLLDGERLFTVEGAISLSENPSLRFFFRPEGARELTARIRDTEDSAFSATWNLATGKTSGS